MGLTDAQAAIGGSIIGAAASLGGAMMTSNSAMEAAKMSRENYQHRYQWTMADMRKAGLNPIFAYQTGVGSSPAGVPANLSGAFSGIQEGINTSIAFKRAQAERDALRSKALSDREGASLARTQNAALMGQIPYIIDTARANAASAKAVSEANQFSKKLVEHDSAFWLRHPYLRNLRNLVDGFSPFVPKTGAYMGFSTNSPQFKGNK